MKKLPDSKSATVNLKQKSCRKMTTSSVMQVGGDEPAATSEHFEGHNEATAAADKRKGEAAYKEHVQICDEATAAEDKGTNEATFAAAAKKRSGREDNDCPAKVKAVVGGCRNHSNFFDALQPLHHTRENSVPPQAPWAVVAVSRREPSMKACVCHTRDHGGLLQQVGRRDLRGQLFVWVQPLWGRAADFLVRFP